MEANLTGIWQGLFSYPRTLEPGLFTAAFIEVGNMLTGSTSEVWPFGPRKGETILAMVEGRRVDRDVTFTKTYEGPDKPNHLVCYCGIATDDLLEIEGTWRIPRAWSGRFLMIRSGTQSLQSARRKFERA